MDPISKAHFRNHNLLTRGFYLWELKIALFGEHPHLVSKVKLFPCHQKTIDKAWGISIARKSELFWSHLQVFS